jgi:transketolase
MPCFNLFDNQTKNFRDKILRETKNIISIEAASTDCWKKYIGINGLSFGIDTFGKSAPYKDIYKHFGLTVQNIVNKSKKSI